MLRSQLEMFYSYGTNPPLYPGWQAYFRKHQPPMLIVWGKNDKIFPAEGEITLNAGAPVTVLMVANTGDRPVQVGSHYHFAETNPGLSFDRAAAHGMRLDIPAGTAVRFEPGQQRTVELVDYAGDRVVFGFRGLTNGALDTTNTKDN